MMSRFQSGCVLTCIAVTLCFVVQAFLVDFIFIRQDETTEVFPTESINEPLPLQREPFRFCSGFPRKGCESLLSTSCVPTDAYFWQAKVLADGCVALAGVESVQSDSIPACSAEVAVVVMSSFNTASRMVAPASGWIPAAISMNMSVIVAVASDEGAAAVRAAAPELSVYSLNMSEQENNGGSGHVRSALQLLAALHPNAKWFMKVDDDAFLFPTNLLHALVYTRVNSSDSVILGNTLSPGSLIASGGAGYVISRVLLLKVLEMGDACFEGVKPEWAEDVAISTCLRRLNAKFIHSPGFNMARPDESFSHWRRHHWYGSARFPVTFHWLKDGGLAQKCLSCSCLEAA
jgi:hypothetical protein